MGLDVYLHRYSVSVEEGAKRERDATAIDDTVVDGVFRDMGIEGWGKIPEGQTTAFWERVHAAREAAGLTRDGSAKDAGHERVDLPSAIHPDHMFRIGYMRSSYNEGGINNVLRNAVGRCLYDVFPGDEYERRVDWAKSLELAKGLRSDFAAWVALNDGLQALEFDPSRFAANGPASQNEALTLVRAELARERHADFRSFSNGIGDWFVGESRPEVVALLRGTHEWLRRTAPCVYVVYKTGKANAYEWYAKALDVVVETCEWVLAQPDPAAFLLHWSS